MFFKIQSGKKNMLQNLKIGLKYWKILKMKIILTILSSSDQGNKTTANKKGQNHRNIKK